MTKVVCGIIVYKEQVLAVQRGKNMDHAGYWELPGGKVEPGENDEACLVRELKEELDIVVKVLYNFMSNRHDYSTRKKIDLTAYICSWDGSGIDLHEHQDYKMCLRNDLQSLKWCPADIPIIIQLKRDWSNYLQ